ncbi:MAG TPA: hypothetical protein PK537_04360 [Candidatus Limiplasma sp.]|nr:hypothetical protein [Candidatus Limiplasma sp.]
MKRIIFFFWIGVLLITSAAADCLQIDADTLATGASLSSRMQGIRIQATVEPPADVRLTITQTDTGTVIYDNTYGERSGTFDSGDIYLPYTGQAATEYTVSLQIADDTLTFTYTGLQARLENNSAYALGPRMGGDWPMATVIDLSQSGTTVPIIASNLYVIGQATFAVSDGMLTVSTSFAASANVTLQSQRVYVLGNPTAVSAAVKQQPAYAVGDAIDVTGLKTALVCVSVSLSYDPFGLSNFTYNANDSVIQSQVALLSH